MHEISHELGPDFATRAGQKIDIREAIGPVYSGLEEAKADVVGMFGLKWLMDHGALPKERTEEYTRRMSPESSALCALGSAKLTAARK